MFYLWSYIRSIGFLPVVILKPRLLIAVWLSGLENTFKRIVLLPLATTIFICTHSCSKINYNNENSRKLKIRVLAPCNNHGG